MSKTGSRYLAIAMVSPADNEDTVSLVALRRCKERITEQLRPQFPHLMLELVPDA